MIIPSFFALSMSYHFISLNDAKKVSYKLKRSLIVVKVSRNNFDFRCLKLLLYLKNEILKESWLF